MYAGNGKFDKTTVYMASTSRRNFIGQLGTVPAAFATASLTHSDLKKMFIHHVYFWLKHPDSKDDKAKLISGLQKLSKVKTIKMFHIGQPAATNRDVIERTYAASWLAVFDDPAAQDSYQTDPIHLEFVEECSSLWTKVIVYDSIDAS